MHAKPSPIGIAPEDDRLPFGKLMFAVGVPDARPDSVREDGDVTGHELDPPVERPAFLDVEAVSFP